MPVELERQNLAHEFFVLGISILYGKSPNLNLVITIITVKVEVRFVIQFGHTIFCIKIKAQVDSSEFSKLINCKYSSPTLSSSYCF